MSYSSTKTKQQFERIQFKGEMAQIALERAQQACSDAARLSASVAKDYGKAILSKGNPTVTITEYIEAANMAQHYKHINQAISDIVNRINYRG